MSGLISGIVPAFALGEQVYFKLGEAEAGHVTALIIEPGGIMYRVCWADTSVSCHYAFEISTDRNYGNN